MKTKTDANNKKRSAAKPAGPRFIETISPNVVEIKRRREWRFDLPLATSIEGGLANGKEFEESTKIENISCTGAYFGLDAAVVVGTELILVVELPEKLGDGRKHTLRISGMIVRLEKPEKKGKRQGVAVEFKDEGEILPVKG